MFVGSCRHSCPGARTEGVRRRIDAGTDRLAGHLDETGTFGVDGHRSAKDAITFVGRLPSAEARPGPHRPAELEADRVEAIETYGPGATPDQYRRTPLQRRSDALVAIFRMAAAAPSDVPVPEPVVNVVIDAETLEDELARVTGGAHGGTDVDNSDLACGYHNRLKETGFRPVRRCDGRYDLLRPDGTRITPPA